MPRSRELYNDWAKVLGISKCGAWLEAATLDAFADEVSSVCDLAPDTLLRLAGAHAPPELPPRPNASGALSFISGTYACYSAAWCPYYKGRLIRGAMELTCKSDAPATFAARYTEAFLGETVSFCGEMFAVGRALHCDLRKASDGLPLFGSFILPGPPASVLCGVLSGSTAVGPDPEPSAVRILVIRVPTSPCDSNKYLEEDEIVSSDLADLGIAVSEAEEAVLQEFLKPSDAAFMQRVSVVDYARIAAILDKLYLHGMAQVDRSKAA